MPQQFHTNEIPDKRQYKRLPSAYPVEFTIVRLQGDLPGIDWVKGQTQNVSTAGLCLETELLDDSTITYLAKENIYLDLRIQTPFSSSAVKTVGEVAWYKKEDSRYTIGIKFRDIVEADLKKLLGRAKISKVLSKFKFKW